MQITVNVTDVDIASVIGEYREYDDEGDYVSKGTETIGHLVASKLAAEAMKDDSFKSLKARVADLRNEEIRAQLKPIVEAAISAPIQRTNEYGHPMGQPTTLHEVIVKEVHAYLTKSVDDGYNRTRITAAQKFVKDAVDQVVKKELAEAVAEEKTKVVAAVRAQAAQLIADAVKQGVGR